jgi:RecA-family ATPase
LIFRGDAAEISKFIDACDTIQCHTGGTMLAVHHSGKSGAQGARGSNSLLGRGVHVADVR